ncbi:MAG TPA: NnrS family protein [Xanthobacteraceae bacterium]|nr:NnrS family protein [Xanthobacteraceae bacterium]
MPIPRYQPHDGPALFSAGFRPFFLAAAVWAALAIPLWLLVFSGTLALAPGLAPVVWHVHEMVYGYGAATLAGFLLTAIPNWTGRLPLQGAPLMGLVLLWVAGRAALLAPALGAPAVAAADLAFPVAFLAVVAREIIAGRNWRNLPMAAALASLLIGNALVHAEALGWSATAEAGNRLGIATLAMLISLVGGRIVPSFTRNWLVKILPGAAAPAPFQMFDRIALALTALALALWVIVPDTRAASVAALVAGVALAARLARWRGGPTWREPLVLVLHLGYGWLALALFLMGLNGLVPLLPPTTALHALTVGAIGTMTLAVMTRASLGHTGHALTAGHGTVTIYALVTLAALLRLIAPLGGSEYLGLLALAGAAWSGAFGLFVVLYAPALARPRARSTAPQPS